MSFKQLKALVSAKIRKKITARKELVKKNVILEHVNRVNEFWA